MSQSAIVKTVASGELIIKECSLYASLAPNQIKSVLDRLSGNWRNA